MIDAYAHGETLAEVVELTLAALERTAPDTPALELCCIAEAILEHAAGGGDWRTEEWRQVYAAAVAGSPRYREAERAHIEQRKLEARA
jgi:hypothetical protein